MLSCETVRERLPCHVVGEDSDEGLREHLAACDTCRDERDSLHREVERLREGLASLSPSPFLQDAVLSAARDADAHANKTGRRHLWIGAGLAATAASLLFAAFAAIQAGFFDRAAGPTDPVAWVEPPPSAATVEAARKGREPVSAVEMVAPGRAMFHDAGELEESSERFLPPLDGTVHRWVYGDKDGHAGKRTLAMGMPARPGVMLLGNECLARMGSVTLSGGDGLVLKRGEKAWHSIGGTSEAEITLAAPFDGGPEARVRVLISTGYAGELLLEETLARALGLNHFEIPGGFEIEGTAYRGQRARARVKIPELDVDVVLEVQVLAREPRPDGFIVPSAPGHSWRMVAPGRVAIPPTAKPGDLTGSEGAPTSANAGMIVSRWDAPAAPASAVAWADPIDRGQAAEWGRGARREPRGIEVSWLDVGTDAPPGSRVLVSRVWRGRTAIPSDEAVVFAEVGGDGRLHLPRRAGEEGSTLRMLVIPPQGEPTFRDLELQGLADAEVEVRIDGDVVSLAVRLSTRGGGDQTTWTVPGGLAADNRWLLDEIGRAIETVIGREGLARPDGSVALRLVIRPDAATRWPAVQRLLVEAVRNQVRRIRFATVTGGATVDQDLPEDQGLEAARPPRPRITIRLNPQPDGTLRVSVDPSPDPAGFAISRLGFSSGAEEMLRAAFRERPDAEGLIEVPPPGAADVRYADVLLLLSAMRAVGIRDLRFSGPPSDR